MSADTLAIIPARRGSEGLPGKNWRLLGGHPLVVWSVAAARAAGLEAWVITDGDEIARAATEAKARIIKEPPELAQGTVGDLAAARYALTRILGPQTYGLHKRRWERGQAWKRVAVVWLRPTSPFRPVAAIRNALKLLTDRVDSVRSITPACCHPWKSYVLTVSGLQAGGTHRWHNKPRQLMPAAYRATGWIDCFWAQNVARGTLDGQRIVPFLTPPTFAVDIDDEKGFLWADTMAHERQWQPGKVIP